MEWHWRVSNLLFSEVADRRGRLGQREMSRELRRSLEKLPSGRTKHRVTVTDRELAERAPSNHPPYPCLEFVLTWETRETQVFL